MPNALVDNAVFTLTLARKMTLGMADDIPADKLTYQPTPNANHTLWILGHLAGVDEFFATTVGGTPKSLPENWSSLFGMGSTPTPNAGDYPPFDEIKSRLAACRESFINWIRGLDDAKLAAPLPESLAQFATCTGGLPFSIAWHEGLHAGQLSAIRKALGMKPKVG